MVFAVLAVKHVAIPGVMVDVLPAVMAAHTPGAMEPAPLAISNVPTFGATRFVASAVSSVLIAIPQVSVQFADIRK